MLALSAGGSANRHPGLRVQVGEAVALVAEREFPDRWEGLIDVSALPALGSTLASDT